MLRFFDGFDSYATADIPKRWHTTTGAHTVTTGGRFGANVLKVGSGGGADYQFRILDKQQFWYFGFAFKFTSPPTGGGLWSFLKIQQGATTQVDLGLDGSNKLCLMRSGVALGGCTGTTVLTSGNWYYVELALKVTTSTSLGDVKGYLGGIQEFSCNAGINTDPAAASGADRFGLGSSFANNLNSIFFDDLYVNDAQGTVNNGVLGDMRVESIIPDGAGNYAQFSLTGAASHFAAVNENPENGDTSYVSSNTPGQYETFSFGNLTSSPLVIAGVQVAAVARKDDAGSRSISQVYRIGGTDYVAPASAVLDSYAFHINIQETNPATSAAWAAAEITALEAGVKLVS